VDGQRHEQTADQQHQGVDAADHPVELFAALLDGHGVLVVIDSHAQEQGAEEHHLGGQEDPHPQRGALVLLVEVLEVLLEPVAHQGRQLQLVALVGSQDGVFSVHSGPPSSGSWLVGSG
jgi:hypothetical protein